MVWLPAKDGEFQTQERSYKEFIKSEDWQQIRKSILEERGTTCERCGQTFSKRNVQIHHKHYDNEFSYENDDDLMVLCKECHYEMHKEVL
jgi:5-methylcytosine-specific restriction endonuclease McrA